MNKRIVVLGQIDHQKYTIKSVDNQHFDLGEIKVIDLPPPTEQLEVFPSDEVQEFEPRANHYFDKVVVQAVSDITYINITKPENVYAGQVEVDND